MTGRAGTGADGCSCAVCGVVVAERTLTWSLQVGARGRQWLCASCTRGNVRSIESRFDEAWW